MYYANIDDNHSRPWVLLLNEQGDILYQFTGNFRTASEVLEVIVDDMNGDGLKDVEVVTYFPYAPDAYRFEHYFFQLQDGYFYMGLFNASGDEFNRYSSAFTGEIQYVSPVERGRNEFP